MDQTLRMPEGTAHGSAIKARVALVTALGFPLFALAFGLAFLGPIAWETSRETGTPLGEVLGRVPVGLWLAIGGGLLLAQLGFPIIWWRNWRPAMRWRGAQLTVSDRGISMTGPAGVWQASWDEIDDLEPGPRGLLIRTHAGQDLLIPPGALEKSEFRGASDQPSHALWLHLGVLLRAYLEAVRRGLGGALDEPPMVVLHGRAARAVVGSALMGTLLGALATTFMLLGFGATDDPGVLLAVLGTPFAALGVYAHWLMGGGVRGVCVGPDGIRYRAVRGTRELRWDEITSVRQNTCRGLSVGARETTVELTTMRIAEANLAALARSEGLAPNQVALAACQHYLDQGR